MNILVIDNEIIARLISGVFVNEEDIEIFDAKTVHDAIGLLQAQSFDCIITEIRYLYGSQLDRVAEEGREDFEMLPDGKILLDIIKNEKLKGKWVAFLSTITLKYITHEILQGIKDIGDLFNKPGDCNTFLNEVFAQANKKITP